MAQTPTPPDSSFQLEEVVSRLEKRIEKNLEARIKLSLAESARRRWTLLLSAVAILGFIGITSLPGVFVEIALEDELTAANDHYQVQFEGEVDYQEFLTLSLSHFNDPQRLLRAEVLDDRLLPLLRRLAESEVDLHERHAFWLYLEQIVATLVAADMDEAIDQIDGLFSASLASHPDRLELLALHFGLRVIGSPEPVDSGFGAVQRLRYYADQAGRRGQRPCSVFWQLLLEARLDADARRRGEGAPSIHGAALEKLLAGVEDLSAEERVLLGRTLDTYSRRDRFMREPNARARRLSSSVAKLQEDYRTSLPAVEPGVDATADEACRPRSSGVSLALDLDPVY